MMSAIQKKRFESISSGEWIGDDAVCAEVVFGTPSKQCAGNGICMVSIRPVTRHACPPIPIVIRRIPGTGLLFVFSKKHISSDTLCKRFAHSYFPVEEKFQLPAELFRAWHCSSRWVEPGQYRLMENETEWQLVFPIQFGKRALVPEKDLSRKITMVKPQVL